MKNISSEPLLREAVFIEVCNGAESTWTSRATAAMTRASYDIVATSLASMVAFAENVQEIAQDTQRLTASLESLQRESIAGLSQQGLHGRIDEVFQVAKNISESCSKHATKARGKVNSARAAVASAAMGREAAEKSLNLALSRARQFENRRAELGRSVANAESANQLKTLFIANMSHEIRTPLAVIKGFAELLAKDAAESPMRQQWIDSILYASQQLEALIGDMLDISKIEAGKIDIKLHDVSLVHLVNEMSGMMESRAQSKGLQYRLLIDGLVPAIIRTDDGRLSQILNNVVGNALKFTQQGTVEVTVKWDRMKLEMSFAVRDEGIGISPAQQRLLFEAFSQADKSISQRFGGTGLGLALSRRLARLLGGDISLTSVEGEGSTFTIFVNTGPSDQSELISSFDRPIREEKRASDSPAQTSRFRGLGVLLVEDSPDVAALLKHILTNQGADVQLAHNGHQGLQCARSKAFDLILMDIQMPDMNGYEATRQLRLEGFHLPILALTARAMPHEEERCRAAGFTDYLTKPVSIHRLLDTIQQHRRQPTSLH